MPLSAVVLVVDRDQFSTKTSCLGTIHDELRKCSRYVDPSSSREAYDTFQYFSFIARVKSSRKLFSSYSEV